MSQFDTTEDLRPDQATDIHLQDPWSSKRRGTRTFVITAQLSEVGRTSRVALTLDDVIAEEVADYRDGLSSDVGNGVSPRVYAAGEFDRSVWEGDRIQAVIRARANGDLEVIRLVTDARQALETPAVELHRVADLIVAAAPAGEEAGRG